MGDWDIERGDMFNGRLGHRERGDMFNGRLGNRERGDKNVKVGSIGLWDYIWIWTR